MQSLGIAAPPYGNALTLAGSILILSADHEPQKGDIGNMGLTLNFTQAVFPLS